MATAANRYKVHAPSNVITPELAKTIAEARAEYERGECTTCRTKEELNAYLSSL